MFEGLTRHPMRWLVGALALLVILSQTVSIVREDQQALILRFGEIERTVNRYRPKEEFGRSGAGLALRIPFFESIQYIDKRILGINMERQQVLSTDQQRLQVDAFARFRITNPVRMYTAMRTEERLQQQLATILGSSLRNELGKRTFATLLSPERGAVMSNSPGRSKAAGSRFAVCEQTRTRLPAGKVTPSSSKSPVSCTWPLLTGTWAMMVFWILACQMRTTHTPLSGMRAGSTNPAWMAKAPAAVDRLPQLPLQSTKALSMET